MHNRIRLVLNDKISELSVRVLGAIPSTAAGFSSSRLEGDFCRWATLRVFLSKIDFDPQFFPGVLPA